MDVKHTVEASLLALSSVDQDRARDRNGVGFNGRDTGFGNSLARQVASGKDLSAKQYGTAYRMLKTYRVQLQGFGIEYDLIPAPQDTDAPKEPQPKLVDYQGGSFLLSFPYLYDLKEALKESVPGAQWDKDGKVWVAPSKSAAAVGKFAMRNQFKVSTEAMAEFAVVAKADTKQADVQDANWRLSWSPDSDIEVETPEGLELYGFQKADIEYALKNLKPGKGVFFGDKMGLGKTPQSAFTLREKAAYPAVIAMPRVVWLKWAKELQTWTPGLRVVLLAGRIVSPKTRLLARRWGAEIVKLPNAEAIADLHECFASLAFFDTEEGKKLLEQEVNISLPSYIPREARKIALDAIRGVHDGNGVLLPAESLQPIYDRFIGVGDRESPDGQTTGPANGSLSVEESGDIGQINGIGGKDQGSGHQRTGASRKSKVVAGSLESVVVDSKVPGDDRPGFTLRMAIYRLLYLRFGELAELSHIVNYNTVLLCKYSVLEKWVKPTKRAAGKSKYKKVYSASGPIKELGKVEGIIFDESHYLKDEKSKRTQAGLALVTTLKPTVRLCLSGTPFLNRHMELLTQLWLIDGLKVVAKDEWDYMNLYCNGNGYGVKGQFGYFEFDASTNEDLLNHRLRAGGIYCQHEKKDRVLEGVEVPGVLNQLPQIVPDYVPVDLKDQARYEAVHADLKKARRNLYYAIKKLKAGLAMKMPAAQLAPLKSAVKKAENACGVLSNEALKVCGEEKVEFVIEWIQEWLDGSGPDEKLIIFGHHRDEVNKKIADHFGAPLIIGGQNEVERDVAETSFQEDPAVRLVVCSIKAANVGINLTAATAVAFVEVPYVPADIEQAIGRAYGRLNDIHGVSVYFLVYYSDDPDDPSIDEHVLYEVLDPKESTLNVSTSGAKRKVSKAS